MVRVCEAPGRRSGAARRAWYFAVRLSECLFRRKGRLWRFELRLQAKGGGRAVALLEVSRRLNRAVTPTVVLPPNGSTQRDKAGEARVGGNNDDMRSLEGLDSDCGQCRAKINQWPGCQRGQYGGRGVQMGREPVVEKGGQQIGRRANRVIR